MIDYVEQVSSLSVFTPVDEETGEPLATERWSDRLWVTEWADSLTLDGLTLSWGESTIYHQGQAYKVPAGSHTFTADSAKAVAVVVWLDENSKDFITIDEIMLDGATEPPPAPMVGADVVRLAWGVIEPNAREMTLHVLRHVKEV